MKKFTLFLVAIFAMVNVANAQRAWAYDLGLTSESESYTFAFKAVTAGDATLVFYKGGIEAATLNLGSVSAGDNTVTKTSEELLEAIQQSGDFTWGVKMTGSAIAAAATLSLIKSHIYYNMMGVVTDIDTESKNFGRVYLQMSFDGKPTYGSTTQTAGFFEFDPLMNLLSDDANNGVKPQLPQGYTLDGSSRDQFHRLHINPKTGDLVFSHNIKNKPGVFAVNPDNLSGDAKNLLDGITGLTGMGSTLYRTSAHCFDNDGALFVMDIYPYDDSGYANGKKNYGYLYKIVDGQAVVIDEGTKWANASIAMASDGRGGLWIAQNRSQIDKYYQLAHIKDGVDFAVDEESDHGFSGAAERGAVAYDQVHNILAWGRERKVMLFDVSYDETTGIPMLTKIAETEALGRNIDCLAFDYAGDLYVGSSSSEIFYKYAVPTNNNTCTTPAKKSQVITLVSTTPEYSVTINVNGNGTVTGANTGTYLEGTELTLTPTPAEHYEFTGWTFEDETTSTDNPLIITVDGDKTITANFAKKQYTLTVLANDAAKGDVNGSGTYEYGTGVVITATPKSGYEFTGWSNGSKANPLTISMEEDTELTANFRAILPSSITLNAHPVKDYSASIVGTMKRAIQYGENTIVLTHEDNGTPHIYNIAHTTKTVTEISQEGVNAAADGFLSISDIALTEDGKLVACNSAKCSYTPSGTNYFYIWNNLSGNPEEWFTSQSSANYTNATVGGTMAVKGQSTNAEVFVLAVTTGASKAARYIYHTVNNGSLTTIRNHGTDNMSYIAVGTTYELNASPLSNTNWIIDGELIAPMEFEKTSNATAISTTTSLDINTLGKKYNGASYLFHNDHHLMIAPYATDDKLAGIKVLGITDGFGSPVQVETNTALVNAIDATTAAATAYVDGDGDLTIYLIADGKVYTFSEKVYTAQTFTVTAIAGEGGTVEGGGLYEESSTATVTASPAEHYDFVSWTEDGAVVSTTAEYSFTVTKDIELTANFQEHAKYTITAVANDENMGTVTGGREYYVGESATLKATAKSGYVFAGWEDGEKNATRTVTVSGNATYTANFQAIAPRAWAYDLKVVEDGDNYKFTFNTTAAGTATLLFADIDGNPVAPTSYDVGPVAVGANTVLVAKASFTENKDVYWSVKMDGEAIPAISEITDQSRGIYDFYNMMGVVVDNNTDSKDFGKIYIQQSYERSYASSSTSNNGITTRANDQKSGVFIYNQELDELNSPSNVGYKPTMPTGYTAIGASRESFKRLAINPTNGNLVFGNNISGEGSVWSIGRDNLTAEATNIIEGATGIDKVNAICYDENGSLYVLANITTGSEKYNLYKFTDGEQTELTLEGKKIFVDSDVAMTSDGRGGLWIAQRRGAITQYSILSHINVAEDNVDFVLDAEGTYKDWFAGNCFRAAIAYNAAESIVAVQGASKILLFKVSYDALTGAPSISKYLQVSPVGNSVDGLAFDYAGDLYTVNSGSEKFQKFTLPTADNICTVPAPESQVIKKEIRYIVTVNVEGNGEVEGVGEYVAGAEAKLKAIPSLNNEFVSWTLEDASTSTDNPLTLTVNSNITITANFKKVSRSLILGTNDEAKGTVSGAGTYDHGTEVEITATPKAGYKLLYWSDRSTENPRTITMTKNEAISAYFVKEYAEEPTFKIEKIWENTQVPGSADGYQAVGWDGNIYMQNKTAGKIKVYTNDTDAAVDYATSNTSGQQIAVDEVGNLIVFNAYFASATPNAIQIYQKGSTTAKAINFTLPNPGRCDFLSASGDIYSAEGGYVYFYCQFTTVVNRVKIANGELVSVDVVGNNITAGNSQNHVMVDIFGNLVAHSRSAVINATINVHTNESMPFALIDHKHSTLGGCSFELGGKELWAYNVGATHYNSEWNLYNMTDKVFMSNETLYAKDKVSKKELGSSNWLNVQVVDENTAYIYQFCPEVAVAVWKVSIETPKYTREVTNGDYGTICLPYGSSDFTGAEFYEIAYLELQDDGITPKGIWLDEVNELEAGKPYIFKATADELVVYYEGEEVLSPVEGKAGLTGTFDGITDENVLVGNYMIANNKFWLCGTGCWLNANRAYIEHDALHGSTTPISPMPGRRRVYMGGAGENSATGTEDMLVPNKQVQKVIENGQLIIIRDGVKYNVQGVRL